MRAVWPLATYDNDGALDVLVCVNGGAPLLLKNNAAKGNNWLGIKLEGVTCNRDAIGARISWSADGKIVTGSKTTEAAIFRRTILARCWESAQRDEDR